MELRVGMELELIKDLDCGLRTVKSGSVFKVKSITDKVVQVIGSIGMGVFSMEEIKEYFNPHKKELTADVKKVIYNDKATIVILKSGVKGVAKCLEEDTYNKEVGYRVAYLKAKIKEMNKEIKKY